VARRGGAVALQLARRELRGAQMRCARESVSKAAKLRWALFAHVRKVPRAGVSAPRRALGTGARPAARAAGGSVGRDAAARGRGRRAGARARRSAKGQRAARARSFAASRAHPPAPPPWPPRAGACRAPRPVPRAAHAVRLPFPSRRGARGPARARPGAASPRRARPTPKKPRQPHARAPRPFIARLARFFRATHRGRQRQGDDQEGSDARHGWCGWW
jgi:hypothetical protein